VEKTGQKTASLLKEVSSKSNQTRTTTEVVALKTKAEEAIATALKEQTIVKEEAEELKDTLRHQLFTRFGTRTEGSAIVQYEKQTGNHVYGKNDRRLVWPFPSDVPDDVSKLSPPVELSRNWDEAGSSQVESVVSMAEGQGGWVQYGGARKSSTSELNAGLEAWERASIHKEAEANRLGHASINLQTGERVILLWRESDRPWCYIDASGAKQAPVTLTIAFRSTTKPLLQPPGTFCRLRNGQLVRAMLVSKIYSHIHGRDVRGVSNDFHDDRNHLSCIMHLCH